MTCFTTCPHCGEGFEIGEEEERLTVGEATLLVDKGLLRNNATDDVVRMPPAECKLLATLMRQPGRVVSADHLQNAMNAWDSAPKTVDVHVYWVRKKLGNAATLRNWWSQGYSIEPFDPDYVHGKVTAAEAARIRDVYKVTRSIEAAMRLTGRSHATVDKIVRQREQVPSASSREEALLLPTALAR